MEVICQSVSGGGVGQSCGPGITPFTIPIDMYFSMSVSLALELDLFGVNLPRRRTRMKETKALLFLSWWILMVQTIIRRVTGAVWPTSPHHLMFLYIIRFGVFEVVNWLLFAPFLLLYYSWARPSPTHVPLYRRNNIIFDTHK